MTLLSVEAAARRGVVEARIWDRTGVPPENPEHRLQDIPFRPEEGFVGGRVRRLSLFVRLAQVHAPKGGVSIGGKQFKGGEFIPGEDLAKATPEEKAAIAGNGNGKPSQHKPFIDAVKKATASDKLEPLDDLVLGDDLAQLEESLESIAKELTFSELTTFLIVASKELTRIATTRQDRAAFRKTDAWKSIANQRDERIDKAAEALESSSFFDLTQHLGTAGVQGFAARKAIESRVEDELKGLDRSRSESGGFSQKFVDSRTTQGGTKNQASLLRTVASRLPRRAADRVRKKLKTVRFYGSTSGLTESVQKDFGARLKPGDKMAGVYVSNRSGSMSELRLNQDGNDRESADTYAHELGHIFDRRNDGTKISDSPFWEQAFDKEIKHGQLSDYATTSRSEGFAEYARLVFRDPQTAIHDFPRCWATFKGNTL